MSTPTSNPAWGTDGGAEITDPGAAKQATGFITGEAPAAGHHNWILREQGAWIDAMRDAVGPDVAFRNMDYKGSGGGLDGGWGNALYYLPEANRYYGLVDQSGTVDVFDSADGETFSAKFDIAESMGVHGSCCEFDGTVYFSYNSIYQTTTGLVADITDASPTFVTMTACTRLVYNTTLGLFIGAGSGGGVGQIETATTVGGTWSSRESSSTGFSLMATSSSSGLTLAVPTGTLDSFEYSSDGISWTNITAPTQNIRALYWVEAAQRFIAVLNDGTLGFTTDGTDWQEVDIAETNTTAAAIHGAVNTPEGLVCFMTQGDTPSDSSCYLVFGLPNEAETTMIHWRRLGKLRNTNFDTNHHTIAKCTATSGQGTHDCGPPRTDGARKWVFTYDGQSSTCVASY